MKASLSSHKVTLRKITGRQADCALLAAKGLTSKEIARQLNISPSTVDTHISSALARYNLRKRSDLSILFQNKGSQFEDVYLIAEDLNNGNGELTFFGEINENNPDPKKILTNGRLFSLKIHQIERILFVAILGFFLWHAGLFKTWF